MDLEVIARHATPSPTWAGTQRILTCGYAADRHRDCREADAISGCLPSLGLECRDDRSIELDAGQNNESMSTRANNVLEIVILILRINFKSIYYILRRNNFAHRLAADQHHVVHVAEILRPSLGPAGQQGLTGLEFGQVPAATS
jgi:hypothetical protein